MKAGPLLLVLIVAAFLGCLVRLAEVARETDGETLRVRQRMYREFRFFAPVALKVLDKAGELRWFELNPVQRRIDAAAEDQLRRRGYVRLLLLKGRQQGASLYVDGRGYWRTSQRRGIRALIIAHEADATRRLFSYVQRFHKYSPPECRPHAARSNAAELVFDQLDGSYRLVTAKTPDSGRSETVQFFHGSEVAFWRHARKVLEGAFQALAAVPGSEGYLESTANGRAGRFWELWDLAEKAAKGEIDPRTGQVYVSEWQALFLAWFWSPEYAAPVPASFKRTKREQLLAKFVWNRWSYELSDAQLQWRRLKVAEFGGGEEGELSFRQEYPSSPEEAFLLSGRKWFSVARVERIVLNAKPPEHRGRLEQHGEEVRWVEDEEGWLEVWVFPAVGLSYVVGADVSEGKVSGDQHSGQVLLRGPILRQVARSAPHCDPDEWGRRLVLVAKWYRNAWLGIERNGLGLTAVTAAAKTQYEKLYRAEVIDAETGKSKKVLGWITGPSGSHARLQMLQDAQAYVRDGGVLIVSPVTAGQCETFVQNDEGRPEAADGAKDDEVMALAIAIQMARRTEADAPGTDVSGKRHRDGPPTRGRGSDCA